MSEKIGTRVGAVLFQSETEVHLLGYGVYEGDFPYLDVTSTTPAPERFTPAWVEHMERMDRNGERMSNPRIRLDSGECVWGCEMWWGNEDRMRAMIEQAVQGGVKLVQVDVAAWRAALTKEQAPVTP